MSTIFSSAIFTIYLLPVIKAAVIAVAGYFLIELLAKLLNKFFDKSRLDLSLTKFLTKAVKITLYCIIGITVLNTVGISTTGLLAALSAAAVGIALALKDSLSNIAGGILLLVSPRFATGDFIEVAGEAGTVMQVDLMHTTLRTLDNRWVVIPNGNMINSQLINYSKEETRRVDLSFSISYEDNAELAKELIIKTAAAHPLVLKEPDTPFARVGSYSAHSVDITARAWCKASDYWNVHFDLLEQVRTAFKENGISIPFEQLDVHIKNK